MLTGFTSVVLTGFTASVCEVLTGFTSVVFTGPQTANPCLPFQRTGELVCVLGGSRFLGGVVVGTHRTRRNTLKLHGIVVLKSVLDPTHPSEL